MRGRERSGSPSHDSRTVDTVDEEPTFGRSNLEVELAQKREAEQAIDSDSVAEVVDVDAEVSCAEAECLKPRHAQQVPGSSPIAEWTIVIASPWRGL